MAESLWHRIDDWNVLMIWTGWKDEMIANHIEIQHSDSIETNVPLRIVAKQDFEIAMY